MKVEFYQYETCDIITIPLPYDYKLQLRFYAPSEWYWHFEYVYSSPHLMFLQLPTMRIIVKDY